MSIEEMTWVLRSAFPSSAHKLVALSLADGQWSIAPDPVRIAHYANVDVETAEQCLADLLDMGLMVRDPKREIYRLDPDWLGMLSDDCAGFSEKDGGGWRFWIDLPKQRELSQQYRQRLQRAETPPPQYQKQPIPSALRAIVLQRDGYRCVECESTKRLCVDHKYPELHGGSLDPANLQTLCRSCNSEKGTKIPPGVEKL